LEIKMKIEIDWKQKSTVRGAIWFGGGAIATLCVLFGNPEGALTIMSIAGMVAGGVGVGIKD
jgi:hypothetical protein